MKILLILLFALTVQVLHAQNLKDDIATIKSNRTASNETIAKHLFR